MTAPALTIYHTVAEAAARLGIHERTLRARIRRLGLGYRPIGGRRGIILLSAADLAALAIAPPIGRPPRRSGDIYLIQTRPSGWVGQDGWETAARTSRLTNVHRIARRVWRERGGAVSVSMIPQGAPEIEREQIT